jgi:nitrogen regulatory protein PII 2
VRLLPKWLLTIVVDEAGVDAAVAALMRANQTGSIGDGKIFVSPIAQTLRVRTDESGYPAIS